MKTRATLTIADIDIDKLERELSTGKRLTVPTEVYLAVGFFNLLTPDGYNPKTKKGRARGHSTAILHLAPANLSGTEQCSHRSPGCTAACLNTAGHGGIIKAGEITNEVQLARIARTILLLQHRRLFNLILETEMRTHARRAKAKGLIPDYRLNGTSDRPWEFSTLNNGQRVMDAFAEYQFYDYTKVPERALRFAAGLAPANYTLVFSRSEINETDVLRCIDAGVNIAVVFQRYLPDVYLGRRVVNGDLDDLRYLDPKGVIVGLKAKGRAKKDASGFTVVQTKPARVSRRRTLKKAA